MAKKKYLEAGQIVGTHGIKGEVRVQPWCDTPEVLSNIKVLYFDDGLTPVNVISRPHKNIALIKIEGINTVNQAAALRGKILYLNREDVKLEKTRYFIQDLIGLHVIDADNGIQYGILTDVSTAVANDIYKIKTRHGDVLIPAIPSVIIKTDLDNSIMHIRPIKGMFDNEI